MNTFSGFDSQILQWITQHVVISCSTKWISCPKSIELYLHVSTRTQHEGLYSIHFFLWIYHGQCRAQASTEGLRISLSSTSAIKCVSRSSFCCLWNRFGAVTNQFSCLCVMILRVNSDGQSREQTSNLSHVEWECYLCATPSSNEIDFCLWKKKRKTFLGDSPISKKLVFWKCAHFPWKCKTMRTFSSNLHKMCAFLWKCVHFHENVLKCAHFKRPIPPG